MQAKVGPTTPPVTGRSLNPPVNKSMSSTCEYTRDNLSTVSTLMTSVMSENLENRRRPHCSLLQIPLMNHSTIKMKLKVLPNVVSW